MQNNFVPFRVGTVFNGLSIDCAEAIKPKFSGIKITYPSRLQAMSLDSSQVTENNNFVYTAGHINFSVDVCRYITVSLSSSLGDLIISDRTERKSLVTHAAKIMREALRVNHGLEIDITGNFEELRHCGLGSSSAIIAGVAAAINEIYGKPLSPEVICRYCSQNHGEEIDDDDQHLMPVQSLGGSAICGHFKGALVISAGQSVPIYRHNLDESLMVVFGMPNDFNYRDSKDLMNAEIENADGFRRTGQIYGPKIAYRLIHEVMPALSDGNLKPCKDLIFDYRWDMGSIANCAFTHPPISGIAENLRLLRNDDNIAIISLSSVGPGFFAVTKKPDYVENIFKDLGMEPYRMALNNDTYKVVES
jgi:homoserine kinase